MSDRNGAKPPPDPNLLTPNDWRRLRGKLGRSPQELLDGAEVEDMYQLLILAYRLREDPAFTWEQAGDIPPGDLFDFTGGDGQSPPDLPAAPSSGSGSSPASSTAPTSRKKRTASANAR
jgi:hypothetical protein